MDNSTTVDSVFQKRFSNLMKERGITQAEASEGIGITRQAISLYATGKRTPDINSLYRICDYFKVSADYFLGLSGVRSFDINDKAISEKLGLNDRSIKILEGYQKYLPGFLIPTVNLLLGLEVDAELASLTSPYHKFTNMPECERIELLNQFESNAKNDLDLNDDPEEPPILTTIENYLKSIIDLDTEVHISTPDDFIGSIKAQKLIDTTIFEDLKNALNEVRSRYNGDKIKVNVKSVSYRDGFKVSEKPDMMDIINRLKQIKKMVEESITDQKED